MLNFKNVPYEVKNFTPVMLNRQRAAIKNSKMYQAMLVCVLSQCQHALLRGIYI